MNIRNLIIENTITPELVEDNFPKGACKERGKAILLHAEMLIAIADLFKDFHMVKKGKDIQLPERKNFNSEVCMWRDDKDMIKEVRGECRGFNSCLDLVEPIVAGLKKERIDEILNCRKD